MGCYAQATNIQDERVVDLSEVSAEDISLALIAERSGGALSLNSLGQYVLNASLRIRSRSSLRLEKAELYIGQWNLTLESSKLHFENFKIQAFSKEQEPKSEAAQAGNLKVLAFKSDAQAVDENPIEITGNLNAILVGGESKSGGSIDLPASAVFELSLEYDLRSGGQGGVNGRLSYSLQGTHVAYEPEGVESSDLSLIFPAS